MTLLQLERVEKHFGGLPAVAGVSLEVDSGELVALVGPNGAGKSTLLKAISGLQPPTRGSIVFDGQEIAGMGAHDVRRMGVAMVLQTPRSFESLNVEENVMLGALFGSPGRRPDLVQARRRAREVLEFVGLADRAGHEVGSLTLHQQRFLDLARALAGNPRLLLLDEVMAGLNDVELQDSIDMVRTARDELGLTVIWVEHVMKAVMSLAERIVVLNFGTILAQGAPREVMTDPNVVAAYLGDEIDSHV